MNLASACEALLFWQNQNSLLFDESNQEFKNIDVNKMYVRKLFKSYFVIKWDLKENHFCINFFEKINMMYWKDSNEIVPTF